VPGTASPGTQRGSTPGASIPGGSVPERLRTGTAAGTAYQVVMSGYGRVKCDSRWAYSSWKPSGSA
jgi:hypothetical protein